MSLATFAMAALALHAIDAWVVQVEGENSPTRRAVYLLGVAIVAAGIWFGALRAGDRWRAVGLLIAGLAGMTVIGPIVLSHILKLGFRGSGITGVLAVVGSVLLIAIASFRLIGSAHPRLLKLLALPVAFVLLQFFMWPLGNAVYATNAARPELGARTPATLGLKYEDVTITSADGTDLAAWYVPSSNGAAVLLRHGSGSTRTATLDHAAFLSDVGYGILLIDARGHGASAGRINELGWHGPQDIVAAVDYLEARPDVTAGIGVLGLSMGGEEAINAAAEDDRIDAVVAEGAGTGTYSDSVADGAHPMARFINWTQYALTDVLSDTSQPSGIEASLPKIRPRPVLLITGSEAIEQTMGPVYARAGGSSTKLWRLPDTPHTDGLRVHRNEYVVRVLGVFDAVLLSSTR